MKTEIVPKSNTPKTKRGEDRQKKLLNTAIKVFLEHGYEGASLEKIILDAGGSRSTIYSLYGSKKGLFLACLKSLVEEVYFAYAEHYDESRPWEEELIVFGRVFLTSILDDRAAKDPDIGNWYYTEGAELSYLCFAKVLENKLPLSLEELKPLAQHYIEMLKADLYMKRLCGASVSLNDQIISDEVRLCADIFIKYLKSRMTQT